MSGNERKMRLFPRRVALILGAWLLLGSVLFFLARLLHGLSLAQMQWLTR